MKLLPPSLMNLAAQAEPDMRKEMIKTNVGKTGTLKQRHRLRVQPRDWVETLALTHANARRKTETGTCLETRG